MAQKETAHVAERSLKETIRENRARSLDKLCQWGVETGLLDITTGHINKEKYVRKLKAEIDWDSGQCGELKIPDSLMKLHQLQEEGKINLGNINILTLWVIMGFGHLRPARCMEWWCEAFGIPVESVGIGDRNNQHQDRLNQAISHANNWYIEASLIEAGRIEDAKQFAKNSKQKFSWVGLEMDILRHFFRKTVDNALKGKIEGEFDRNQIEKLDNILYFLFAKDLKKIIDDGETDIVLNLYPLIIRSSKRIIEELNKGKSTILKFFNDIGFTRPEHDKRKKTKKKISSIGTDHRIEPAGWRPEEFLWVAAATTQNEIAETWGGEFAPNIKVASFVSPAYASMKAGYLADRAKEILENGGTPVAIMPCSQVAPVMEHSYQSALIANQEDLRNGKLRAIIQCGDGWVGKPVFDRMSGLVKELGIEDNVVLHLAEDPIEAVDLFETVTASPIAKYVDVKTSEISQMDTKMGLPHIVKKIIGLQEEHNAFEMLNINAAVVFLYDAYDRLIKFISSQKWPDVVIASALLHAEKLFMENEEAAAKWAKEQLLRGKEGLTDSSRTGPMEIIGTTVLAYCEANEMI